MTFERRREDARIETRPFREMTTKRYFRGLSNLVLCVYAGSDSTAAGLARAELSRRQRRRDKKESKGQ